MNTILEQINTTGRSFVDFAGPMLLQSSILIFILLLADFLLRKKVRAVIRYWIWMLVLVKLILPSSLSSPLSLGYFFGDQLQSINFTKSDKSIDQANPAAVTAPYTIEPANYIPAPVPTHAESIESVVLKNPAFEPTTPEVQLTALTWQGAVFIIWITVVIIMGLLLLQRALFVRGLVAQAKNAASLMNETLEFCRQQMKIKTSVRLKVSPNATTPAVCGLSRPVILVPQNLGSSLGVSGLRAVLFHELAHIKRADLWVNLAQTLLQILYFYNPLLWLANAIIRRIREQAVDEAVLVAMGEKANQYPETLVNIAKLAFKRPALSLRLIGVVESKSQLTQRIKHILSRPFPKKAKLGLAGLIAIIITAAILLPMAKGEWEKDIRNPVSLDEKGKPVVTHTLYIQGQPEEPVYLLEEKTYNSVEPVVAHIGELMKQKPFPYIRVYTTSQFQRQQEPIERLTRLCREIGFINMEFKYDLERSPDSFKITLSNGVTVELVGVCEYPSQGKQWWRPDGSLVEVRPYLHLGYSMSSVSKKVLEVAFKTNMSDDEIGFTINERESGGLVHPLNDNPIENIWAGCVNFDKDAENSSFLLGVATGRWTIISKSPAEGSSGQSGSEGDFTWGQSYQKNKSAAIPVTHNIRKQQQDYRVVAIDTSGNTHTSWGNFYSGSNDWTVTTSKFRNLTIEKIKEFQFQIRPYEWVEFKNVSLKPDFKTDVQVENKIIVPGERVGEFTLDMSKDDVLKMLGKPKTIFYRDQKYTLDDLPRTYFMVYDDIAFGIVDDWVEGVSALSHRYKFTNGLGVGDSEQKIKQAFGDNYRFKETEGKDYLTYEDEGIQFEIHKKDRTVMELSVFKIAEPVNPSPKPDVQVLSFGPVIERQIQILRDENNAHAIDFLIDFETNRLSRLPKELSDLHEDELLNNWCRENQIDAAAIAAFIYIPGANWGGGGIGLCQNWGDESFLLVSNEDWNSVNPEELMSKLQSEKLASTTDFDSDKSPVTYGFKTIEGNVGLLQIFGVAQKNLKIRYKMVYPLATQKPAVQVEVEKTENEIQKKMVSFGPVIEVVINKQLIDLDTGKTFSSYEGRTKDRSEWYKANGIDLSIVNLNSAMKWIDGDVLLGCYDMIAVGLKKKEWETITPIEVAQKINAGQRVPNRGLPVKSIAGAFGPSTYAIETREGGMGIVQIMQWSNKPKGVYIRYRMIQGTASVKPAVQGEIKTTNTSLAEWAVAEGGNGHFYEPVIVPGGINWNTARQAAEQAGGYLVTITSQQENDFVFDLIQDKKYWNDDTINFIGPWIGSYQPRRSPEPDGNWQWITGEPFEYSNWDKGRPNNAGIGEDCANFGVKRAVVQTWNDLPGISTSAKAYIVEYEPLEGKAKSTFGKILKHEQLDPRQVVETFLTAAQTGEYETADKFTKPGSAAAEQTQNVHKLLDKEIPQLIKVFTDQNTALAVTSTVLKDNLGNEDVLVFSLVFENNLWLITKIDLENSKKAQQLLEKFNQTQGKISTTVKTNAQVETKNTSKKRHKREPLPKETQTVMLDFQEALKESHWKVAMSYCSRKVKSKAVEYKSIESFFKDVLPIDKITALSEFQVSGTGSRNDEVISYRCNIRLEDPNSKYRLNWNLSVHREDSNWVVEFPTKPFDVWVKHEDLKRKFANEGLRFDEEKIREGFDVRLVPLREDFTVGKPMLFRLEMKNISDKTLGYIYTSSVMVNDPLSVIGPKGNNVPYLGGDSSVGIYPEFAEPGETVTLADNYDVRSQYHIIKPGRYSFQFRGSRRLKPSNIVEFDIKPGQLSALEIIVENLMPILPKDWTLSRTRMSDIADFDLETDRGVIVNMVGKGGRKGKAGDTVAVLIVIDPSQSFLEITEHEAELWGQSKWGPVYVKSLDAEQLWPDYKEQIINALGIQSPQLKTDVQGEAKRL